MSWTMQLAVVVFGCSDWHDRSAALHFRWKGLRNFTQPAVKLEFRGEWIET